MRRAILTFLVLFNAVLCPAALGQDRALEPKVLERACDPNDLKIGIDIGHTTESQGAKSARGVFEYSFNAKLAGVVADNLKAAGFRRTQLITVGGIGSVQLERRIAQANSLGLDLFLSLHHDSVQNRYLTHWIYEGTAQAFSDKFSGYSLFVSMQNPVAKTSLLFARLIGEELHSAKLPASLHHAEHIPGENRQVLDPLLGIYRYDGLVVLRENNAPAVLLEAGIIVNRKDEIDLAGIERQRVVAQAIVRAVTRLCRRDPPASFMPHD